MLRTFMSDGKLQFVYDVNTSYNPIFSTYVNSNNDLIIADPMLTAPRPIFRTDPTIPDVNNDPDLRKRMTKYFYDKYKSDWVYGSFSDLYKYLVVSNGEVKLGKSDDKDDKNDNIKAEFLVKEIFSKYDMLELLDKYVHQKDVNWYDLRTKHKTEVKDYIHRKIKKHMSSYR